MAFFEINNLLIRHKSYDGVKTVLDIDHLEIEKGRTLGVVGESGQGKTVLALSALGLLNCPPGIIARGEVILDGENLIGKKQKYLQKHIRGKKAAMVFQDPMSCLNPVYTVGSQLIDVLRENRKLSKKAAREEAVRILGEVKLADAENTMTKYPHQLSGGQRQRVIIALTLCCNVEFLIADEPTRNLDVTIQASILKLLKELQVQHGLTVLFIANNLSLVSAFCDRVAILYGGKIIEQAGVETLIRSPQHQYTKALIRAVGTERRPADAGASDEVILEVQNLKKHFIINDDLKKQKNLTLKAVDDVSFQLHAGEVLGIVGESGCGKSTLVNTILGLFDLTGGKVLFEGQDIHQSRDNRAIKKKVQIVFQDPYWSLNPRWLVKDIIAEPIDVYEKLDESERLERVCRLLQMVGLSREDAFKYPHEFSGGQRQRIAIARSLASSPRLVVLDEPTSSIDMFSQMQIMELLRSLKQKFRLTNILISHDLGVVHEMSNVIAVMYLGKIVEFGPADRIFNHPQHPYTQALFQSIPRLDRIGMEHLETLEGVIPSPINPPSGCPFHTRCKYAVEACAKQVPKRTMLGENDYVACLRFEQENEIPKER